MYGGGVKTAGGKGGRGKRKSLHFSNGLAVKYHMSCRCDVLRTWQEVPYAWRKNI
jgi:hypothetical protein